jgi:hypothetical protein
MYHGACVNASGAWQNACEGQSSSRMREDGDALQAVTAHAWHAACILGKGGTPYIASIMLITLTVGGWRALPVFLPVCHRHSKTEMYCMLPAQAVASAVQAGLGLSCAVSTWRVDLQLISLSASKLAGKARQVALPVTTTTLHPEPVHCRPQLCRVLQAPPLPCHSLVLSAPLE